MSLPKLETPIYELILPSSGEKIKYRPFLVREYKILLTTLDSDSEEIHRVITELVDICTFKKLNVNTLANFDIEYIFLNMRAKSVGEVASITVKCTNCENKMDAEMDLTKATIERSPDHTQRILITDTIGIEMRYPKFEEMIEIYQNFKSDKIVEMLCSCISTVFTEEELYNDYTNEELIEFVNSFSKEQFEKLEQFFLTMPKVVQHIEKDCDKCGTHNNVKLEGLQNFFV